MTKSDADKCIAYVAQYFAEMFNKDLEPCELESQVTHGEIICKLHICTRYSEEDDRYYIMFTIEQWDQCVMTTFYSIDQIRLNHNSLKQLTKALNRIKSSLS